uniref:Rho GTPase-activating protein 19 n=2 Tax=Lygus hesperus TaxID=30085 RepID=A0A146KR12_LYGHE
MNDINCEMSCDNSVSSNRSLAKRMRLEDPDQFQTLVRMHLSFVLHLTLSDTEADGTSDKPKIRPLKWGIAPFTRKLKNLTKETAKEDEPPGVPLTRSTVAQVNKLITYLTKEENIVQEGVFRRSGKLTRQQELKAALAKNGPVDLSSYSVHDVASVLKSILAELPEPLLTDMYYPAYCQIADLCSGDQSVNQSTRVLRSLQLLFLLLPRENRRLLKNLLRLLHLTASHEDSNRMSPQNIATLFTPHLLCSRKLSPEVFHSTAANLSCVVVFMINESTSTFGIPEALATDIHAYWEGKRKNTFLERSISEAKTVFSFTDRELSQREDAVNPTETALAQLYAHIQGLPESSHKKRLIKQFNKENGNGTPRTKSLGISIKKHIFSKNAKAKGYTDYLNLKNSGMSSSHHSLLNSPERKMPRTPLTAKLRLNLGSCSDQKRSPSVDDELGEDMTTDDSLSTTGSLTTTPPPSPVAPPPIATGNFDSPRRHWPTPDVLTSTPAVCPSANTPVGPPDDMSPITRSAQRMPKAMQEAMITPRSRKPVVALSGSNLCQPGNSTWVMKDLSWGHSPGMLLGNKQKSEEEKMEDAASGSGSMGASGEDSLTSPFRDYLFSRSVLTGSPADLSFSSRTGDFDPSSSADATGARLSDSLLYFLDGGSPSSIKSSGTRLKRDRSSDDVLTSGKRSELESSSGLGSEAITETSL